MPDATITVPTPSRTYPVHVGPGLLDRLDDLLRAAGADGRRIVVSSPTVWECHGASIGAAGRAADSAPPGGDDLILIPDGERAKTIRTVSKIHDGLARAAADRSVTIVAVGGGVVGDVAGFAAATWLRGVRLAHVPTTLLAQVDSAIGGKVGVNHPLGKNLIGAFHQPIVVVADPTVLRTLPRREFQAGLYEVVKYGVIADPDLLDRVAQNLPALMRLEAAQLAPVIAASCRVKARIVASDEREAGARRVLNFGHTAGHAFEAVTRYRRFRHGEAVAHGMLAAADLAVRRGCFAEDARAALAELVARIGALPPISDLSATAVVEAMRRDKKMVAGRLHVILPTGFGATRIVDDVMPPEFIRSLRAVGTRA